MSESNQSKKKGSGQSCAPKESKTMKFKGGRNGGEFRIGSRDILATPEILSPFDYDETPKSHRKGKSEAAPTEEKPVAPTHNRKGKKKADEPAEAPKAAEAPKKGSRARTPAKPEAAAPKKEIGKETAKTAKKAAAPAETPKKAPSKGRRGAPSIVSAEDSVVIAADTVAMDAPKQANRKPSSALRKIPGAKLRVIPLGGLGEIGKNLTVLEYSDSILIVDCGLGFPNDDMLGVDLVVNDITYLVSNADKIKGLVLTHGHEDHIGGIPYLLQKLDLPIYGTRLTLGILQNKLAEHVLGFEPEFHCVEAGDKVKLGLFEVEFIHVNHSIADACALAIKTPIGTVIHTGDFKIDTTPVEGEMTDLTRFGQLGKEGVLLLMCESTNAERPGYTPSEHKISESLTRILDAYKDKRIVIATFSSNVHRIQQIINKSAESGRKVAVTGRSMINIVSAAIELGYMNIPEGVLVDITEIKRYPPEKLTVISTGSQGEPMSALYRMAFNMHDKVELGTDDVVVISASAIPGNEKLVGNIINELYKKGVTVLNDSVAEVHVSGHACQEELKIIHALTKPEYFMPIHGEARHNTP